jgi:hypothetical protein
LNGVGEQGQEVSIQFIKSDTTPETPFRRLDQVRVGDEMAPTTEIIAWEERAMQRKPKAIGRLRLAMLTMFLKSIIPHL